MRYLYSIARYMPDAARGEFVNAGLVVGRDDELVVEFPSMARGRVKALKNGIELLPTAHDALRRIHEVIDRQWFESKTGASQSPTAETLIEGLAERYRNVIQFTQPTPISAESIDEALEIVSRLRLETTVHESRGVTRLSARAELKRTLFEQLPPESVAERVLLTVGNEWELTMDFAVRNGAVRQLSHAFSFYGRNVVARSKEIRAWAWTMDVLKDDGGSLTIGGKKTTVPPYVPVAVFIATPAQEPDDFDSAMHLFDRLNVEVEHDAKLIADRAEGLLVGHS